MEIVMENPLFSIAIPAFKGSFLRECIESVLTQTYRNFELIIVNDNSPEDLESILSGFRDDSRIVYKKNSIGYGAYDVSKNWNECLKLARGEFFMCIGDDDRLLPDCLHNYLSLITAHPDYPIYHAGTQLINEESEVFNVQESRPITESAYSMIWHRWFVSRKTFIGDYLFRTTPLKEMGGFLWFPYAWGSDEQTVYLMASKGGIANMQGFGFQYRVNHQTISYSRENYKGKIEAYRLGKEWFIGFLKKEPDNPTDSIYWKIINDGLEGHFSELYKMVLKDDFCYNGRRHFNYWKKNRMKYGLSLKNILYCYAIGIKKRRAE